MAEKILKGTITCDGLPVPFANILIKESKQGIAALADGSYVVEDISEGNYEVIISALGYVKYKKTIFIKQGINNFSPSLTKSPHQLDQVVVTGSMKETYLRSSPVKLEVVTQKLLTKFSTSNVMELIDNVNGIKTQINCGVCGTNEININGMKGPYTLVLIDGMPIMSSLSSVYGLNGIPTSFIKQIEIVKGPSSTLYGSEAVAGVINIITKKSLIDIRGYYTLNSTEFKNELVKITGKKENPELIIYSLDSLPLISKIVGSNINISLKNGSFRATGKYYNNETIKGRYQNIDGAFYNFIMIKDSTIEEKESTFSLEIENTIPAIWTPNKSYGFNKNKPIQESVLFKNATVWTNEQEGVLLNTDVIISNGKIIVFPAPPLNWRSSSSFQICIAHLHRLKKSRRNLFDLV